MGDFLLSTLVARPSTFFRAFTLIEMILAVGVAAMVLAVVGGVFFAALASAGRDAGGGGRGDARWTRR